MSEPKFLDDENLRAFIEASDVVFVQVKSGKDINVPTKGFFSSLLDKVTNVQASVGVPNEVDLWFDNQNEYWKTIQNNLALLLNRSSAISKEYRQIYQIWNEFSLICNSSSSIENSADPLLSKYFKKLSEITTRVSDLNLSVSNDQTDYFDDTLRDWIRVIDAIFEILSNRKQDLWLYQSAIKTKESKQESYNKKPSEKLKTELNDAELKESSSKDQFENISKSVREQLERVIQLKAGELISSIRFMSEKSKDLHTNCASLWKEVLLTIEENEQIAE